MADSKVVKLSPDRWEILASHFWPVIRPTGEQILEVREPTFVHDVLYLPALYRAA